jgi:hypothetical protein
MPSSVSAFRAGRLARRLSGMNTKLNVYDLGPVSAMVNGFAMQFDTGFYHAGVELEGIEISFGAGFVGDSPDATGIFECVPRQCEGHVYRETINLGVCSLPAIEIQRRVLAMKAEDRYKVSNYNVVNNNCVLFCCDIARRLGVSFVPERVFSLSAWASGHGLSELPSLQSSSSHSQSSQSSQPSTSMQSSSSQSQSSQPSQASTFAPHVPNRRSPVRRSPVRRTIAKRKVWKCSCGKAIVQKSKALDHVSRCSPGAFIVEADESDRPALSAGRPFQPVMDMRQCQYRSMNRVYVHRSP